ncbi:MAG: hypothetical protein OXF61_06845 [Acidimicrobiaceae bacterium]|nr:hypothetical protein [Acidimicrobiaceae bacterium]
MIGAVAVLVVLAAAGIGTGILLRSDDQPDAVPESMAPGPDCVALHGPQPWIILWDRSLTQPCVVVAEFQDVQVWNKGLEPMTVDWPGGERRVAIDEHFDSGPIGNVLRAGPNDISAAPFPMPTIWLLPESMSPTSGIEVTDAGFGPVRIGMTFDEAEAALGLELELSFVPSDPPASYPWEAVVSGDPYSPMFLADGPDDETSVIFEIHPHNGSS